MRSLFIEHIHEVFAKRKQRNSLYSLRSFARDLGLSSGKLSEMMRNKIKVSEKVFLTIAKKLEFNNELHNKLHSELMKYNKGRISIDTQDDGIDFTQIFTQQHLAISALFDLPMFENNLTWIANALSFDVDQCQILLDDLVLSGMITVNDEEYFKPENSSRRVKRPGKEGYKDYFKTGLLEAAKATDRRGEPLHWFNSTIAPMNEKNFKTFKSKMNVLMEELNYELSQQDEEADNIYHVNVACYPITNLSD